MAIRSRRRRKIEVDGQSFIWFVRQESDYAGRETLYIVSQDKQMNVRFPLPSPHEIPTVVVVGRKFGGSQADDGCWRYFRAPEVLRESAIAPSLVRALIEWSLSKNGAVELDSASLPNFPLGSVKT